jgi:protein SCO1/2
MQLRTVAAALVVPIACVIAACTNGGGLGSIGGGGGSPSPFPSGGIGIGIPTGKIGVENDPTWGTVSGYTQNQTSQIMAFPPGSKITVKNLSTTTPHTLNVVAVASAPPAHFPPSPSLSFSPRGNGVLGPNYASGTLNPQGTVTLTLSKPGIYLIGCAFHYVQFHMRDVVQVIAGATPGPTASPGPGGYDSVAPQAHAARAAPAVPQTHLVDQQRRAFTLLSLRGRPLAVTFVAAHCTDACPLINAQFSAAAKRIAREHLRARLLTITLDPEHDSPATMRELAKRFDADPRYWLLAGGSTRDVHRIMRTFGVISVEGQRGYHDRHTTFVYLLRSDGKLVQTMLASTALTDALVEAFRDRNVIARR